MILRGGAEQFIEETERSLHDAIMIVRRAIKNDSVVAGTVKHTKLHKPWKFFNLLGERRSFLQGHWYPSVSDFW